MHDAAPIEFTVARLAELAGVSVRTLHHYDQVGLLVPNRRSDAGYRMYGVRELARLREVLVWRRLGLPLAEVAQLLDDPAADRAAVLRAQRELVRTRAARLSALAAALDDAISSNEAGTMTTDHRIIEALDGFDPAEHEAEAAELWGDTDAWRQSESRTANYTPEDWARTKTEAATIHTRLLALFDAGADPAGADALEQAEAWREHVTRSYYDVAPSIQRHLGQMYVVDPRFRATYDGVDGERPGMAEWVRDAWAANADRHAK